MKAINTYFIISILLSVIGCKSEKEADNSAIETTIESTALSITTTQFAASEMAEGKLENRQFEKQITVNGKLHLPHKSKAVVSSVMGGTLGKIDLVVGQWVRKGQTLFAVTNPELIDLQQEYLVLQSKVNYLRNEQERKQQLASENLTAQQNLLLAQADYQTNQAKLSAVSQKLKLYGVSPADLSLNNLTSTMSISAPISGHVSAIEAEQGQYISPSTEILAIANSAQVQLELKVMERDALLISKGQKIHFNVPGSPNSSYAATVSVVVPSVNDSGMVSVHCQIDKAEALMPGMYATADIILTSHQVQAVPEEAVVMINEKAQLLVQSSRQGDELSYLPVSIEKGAIENGYVEIMNPEAFLGKTILVKGGYYLVN